MGYKIAYKKSVAKDLPRIGKAETRRILDRIERELRRNPEKTPALKGRYAGLRRLRIGDYRVIFALIEDEILILRIRYRKDVYRD